MPAVEGRLTESTIRSLFFFNDTATTEIYTLSLHDALPIYRRTRVRGPPLPLARAGLRGRRNDRQDRKSTRLNSSHPSISYAVFCLKKKNGKGNRELDAPNLNDEIWLYGGARADIIESVYTG